jgi:hypothetical protein
MEEGDAACMEETKNAYIIPPPPKRRGDSNKRDLKNLNLNWLMYAMETLLFSP